VKLPASVGRTEVQAPIDEAAPDEPPALIREAVRSRVRSAQLEPIARIATTRTATLLLDASGAERIEFADDRVRATDIGAGVVRTWREWEAEQVGDDAEASARMLAAVDAALLAEGAEHSASPAKLAQALGGLEREETKEAAGTAGDVFRGLVAGEVEQLHRDAFALQHGEPDAVHAMRKTVRRLRSLLALEAVGGEEAGRLRERLRTVGATLGDARDAAVGAEEAAALLDDLGPDVPGVAEARGRLVDQAGERAEAARLRALAAFGASPHLALLEDLDRFAEAAPSGPRAAEPPTALADLAHRAVRRAGKRARRAGVSLESLHDARKAAKRARYLIDALEGAPGIAPDKALARLSRRAAKVQQRVGAHRDLAVVVADLPFAAARATAERENAFVYGVLAERGSQEAARRLRRAARALDRLRRAAG
jgi:CHAD domain-containing protein